VSKVFDDGVFDLNEMGYVLNWQSGRNGDERLDEILNGLGHLRQFLGDMVGVLRYEKRDREALTFVYVYDFSSQCRIGRCHCFLSPDDDS
jgi:hypothetical protein